MGRTGKPETKVWFTNRKMLYRTPRLRIYGEVARVTGKPGTRGDGSMGSTGDKGQGH